MAAGFFKISMFTFENIFRRISNITVIVLLILY